MMIRLNQIDTNPYRDFNLDPLDKDRVKRLADSITDLDFWGGLAVRKQGDRYQLAFGHHRLEALRSLNWLDADIILVDYDEDQMVKAMVIENATQRGSEGGSTLDAVGAVIRRLGYLLLTQDNKALCDGSKIFEPSSVEKTRADFLNGQGIGEVLIHKYEPVLSLNDIRQALVSLKQSNHLHTIMVAIQDVIEIEAIAAQAHATALKDAKAKQKAQALADQKAAAKDQAAQAAAKADVVAHYDPLVETVFNRLSHTVAFREAVTSLNGKKYLPVNQQYRMAGQIIIEAKASNKPLTAAIVRDKVESQIAEALGMAKKAKAKILKENNDAKAAQEWKNAMSRVVSLRNCITSLNLLLNTGAKINDTALISSNFLVVAELEKELIALNQRINIADASHNVVANQ